jgi:dCMP deaminase
MLYKLDETSYMSDPTHVAGAALDRCICVHAEQNAMLAAARYGIRIDGSTLYTTLNPCFGCLKEAIQAGINRIVYGAEYHAEYSEPVKASGIDLPLGYLDEAIRVGEPT